MNKSNSVSDRTAHLNLMLGGPLYQMFLRTHMAQPPLELLRRRLIFFPLITWVPPLIFSVAQGSAFGGIEIPFFHDIAMHVRFLVALPLFLIAEVFVHERLTPLINLFLTRHLITPADVPRYHTAISSAHRWRNSIGVELLLLMFSYSVGHALWLNAAALEPSSWYMMKTPEGAQLTRAGLWYVWVSMPIFQFMYLRWVYRLLIWTRFLWQVSRLRLRLLPTHPDRAAGLGFLAEAAVAFAPLILANGAVISGLMAGRIFFEGASLVTFKMEVVALVVMHIMIILGPLCAFSYQMAVARRGGLADYGSVATRYVEAFDRKWNGAQSDADESFLGSADIQSLADMGNSYQFVANMRVVPFGQETILRIIVLVLVPIVPLVLTIIPLEQLITKLLGIPF